MFLKKKKTKTLKLSHLLPFSSSRKGHHPYPQLPSWPVAAVVENELFSPPFEALLKARPSATKETEEEGSPSFCQIRLQRRRRPSDDAIERIQVLSRRWSYGGSQAWALQHEGTLSFQKHHLPRLPGPICLWASGIGSVLGSQ